MKGPLTLGVEEEYQICDPSTGDLAPIVDQLLEAAPSELRDQLGYELLHTVLEGDIPVASGVDEAVESVRQLRCSIIALAEAQGVAIGIGGAHPFADWRDQGFVDTPGYQWVGHQLRYLALRNMSFGLHVHVGVEDDEARVYIVNQLRRWCAPLLALSANAPFFEGVDTGFQTIRWAHHVDVIEGLIGSGAITAPRQVWWNVRPHMTYGTVELRMLDMQIDLERVRTFVALSQALTAGLLADFEAGRPEWELEPAYLEDGWFKAQRFDWEAEIAHPVSGEVVTLRQEMEALRDAAEPWAAELDTTVAAIEGLDRILADGPETDWQRARWIEADHDLQRLQREIIERVKAEARCEQSVSPS